MLFKNIDIIKKNNVITTSDIQDEFILNTVASDHCNVVKSLCPGSCPTQKTVPASI